MRSFMSATDIMNLFGCGRSKAYGIVHELNLELKAKGFRYNPSMVSFDYFCERYNLDAKVVEGEVKKLEEEKKRNRSKDSCNVLDDNSSSGGSKRRGNRACSVA